MSGGGRRSGSKWDMKEDVSPEKHRDISRSKAGNSSRGHDSREYMQGRRGFQREERMNEESMLGWEGDGHYTRRMSPSPDGWRQQNLSRSPRRSRGRSYRSRSKSRSRSPVHNLRREQDLNYSSTKSGRSASLCRDFAAGRCRKGDHCRFAHHGSPNHDSRKCFESRTGNDWESRRRDDGDLRHHSDTYSTGGRSIHVCNDFLKGRCNRGVSCKYRHHDSGSDDFGKATIDGNYRDGDNDWRNKGRSSYDHGPRISSEPLCKFFAAGNCRNGKHCKFSHREEHVYPERRSPDDRQLESSLDGKNEVWIAPDRGNKTSLRNVPEARGWEVDRSDFMDPGKSGTEEWSKNDLLSHELDDPTYMRGAVTNDNEKIASIGKQSLQWNINDISISESKGIEKGFNDGNMLSPKGIFNSRMSLASQKSDSLPFTQISLPTGEQDLAQRASAEKQYISGIMQPNMSGDYLQHNPSFQADIATEARNNGSSYLNANVPADICSGQGIHQTDGGFRPQPISSMDTAGQGHPKFPLHLSGREDMQMPHHQAVIDTNLAMGQSHSTFPSHHLGEGLQMPHNQPVVGSNLNGAYMSSAGVSLAASGPTLSQNNVLSGSNLNGAYMSSAGVSQAASGPSLSQNSVLSEQLVQYSHLSATLAQLLEKRQQLPQLYAAIAQQTAVDGGSNLSNSSVSVPPLPAASSQPNQASEPIKQYDPMSDSMETKVASTSKELLPNLVEQRSSVFRASEIPSLTCNPTSFATGGMITGDLKVSSCGDQVQRKSDDLNVQGPVVASKEENGQATGKGVNETQEDLDQGPTEDMALDSEADGGKKAKDAKGIRPFKFALAEFVKELMKPTWKEGQMSKEVYKTIVKKVVDKVTDTIQVAHIPRTKEKIDQYLSFSKPKLSKLVQAYLEKYQKT